ncbi:unnamed protein product [Brassica rapa subsp. trilocularis]
MVLLSEVEFLIIIVLTTKKNSLCHVLLVFTKTLGGTMNRKLWVKTVGTKSLKFINLGRKSWSVRDQLRHIPLLTELRYDYGMSYDTGEVDEDGSRAF